VTDGVTDVAGLVLAAGAGRRYGMPKALVRLRGRLLIELALETLACCDPVFGVIGAAGDQVRAVLPGAPLIDNPDWPTGMGSSLRVGLAALERADAVAVIVLPVDTPGVTPAAVRRMAEHATPDSLRRASYDGEPGHPVLIGRAHWAGVRRLADGDAGAREYFRRNVPVSVPCEDISDGADVDTPGDLPAS
jgi:nicotine blue oxidoreductase